MTGLARTVVAARAGSVAIRLVLAPGCGDAYLDAIVAADAGSARIHPPRCALGEVLCGAECADPAKDPAHCGACGHACATTEVCSQGVCADACSTGLTACDRS